MEDRPSQDGTDGQTTQLESKYRYEKEGRITQHCDAEVARVL